MSLTSFLNDLFEHGRVATVSAAVSTADQQEAVRLLRECERCDRANWPDGPPTYSEQIGLWSANLLYRACHFVVDRDANPESLSRVLMAEPPEPFSATTHYSADLTLRFLPDVLKLARSAAGDDPLVAMLLTLGEQWPLASVGMGPLPAVNVRCIVADPCLRQAYVDRILKKSDLSRLNNSTVRQAIQASLGLYPELAQTISAEIERFTKQEAAS
ncbi:MAG: hypothetical protein KDB05_04770 [Planctomycetales bacterium]|nr:hypothetical protein [Planctomycetales bacterium]